MKSRKNEESYDVFISYRRSNGFYMAKSIATWLKERKLKVFFDLDEATIGHFDERIEMALRNSKNVVLIMTEGCFDGCVVNGCTNEDDWIANEIRIASEMNPPLNIVPVKANGFMWPKEIHEQLPTYIKDLKRQERVSESVSYIDAMVDRICQYLVGVKYDPASATICKKDFLLDNIVNNPACTAVDIAIHTGLSFAISDTYSFVLDELKKRKIPTRILINEDMVLSELKPALEVKSRDYATFKEVVNKWEIISNDTTNNISVKISPYPLMKRYYKVASGDIGIMKVAFYTYGGKGVDKDLSLVLSSTEKKYDFFCEEFEFLWNQARDIMCENNFIIGNILNCSGYSHIDVVVASMEEFETLINAMEAVRDYSINARILINEELKVGIETHDKEIEILYGRLKNSSSTIKIKVMLSYSKRGYCNIYSTNEKEEISDGIMKLIFYTDEKEKLHHNYSRMFSSKHKHYKYFKDEFEYLWDGAREI